VARQCHSACKWVSRKPRSWFVISLCLVFSTFSAAEHIYHAKENLASAKIVKIEFNANLDLLGFPHFITFKECRKVP